MNSFIIALIAIFIFSATNAQAKSFTKDELTKMLAKKKFPKLGEAKSTDKSLDFSDCENFISEQRVGMANEGWPTKVLKETSSYVLIEIWGSNAKTTLKCDGGSTHIEVQDYVI